MTGPPVRRRGRALALCALLAACGSDAGPAAPDGPEPEPEPEIDGLALTTIVTGLERPLGLTAPPDDARLFVVEQTGAIRIVRDGTLVATPFLDLSDRVLAQGERGLLGLAFHPDYALNGRFFVNYTDQGGTQRIVEFGVGGDPDRADPLSGAELLAIPQPFGNHNGGHLAFGPDGMLYIGVGDGGGSGDPQGHGQNVTTLLGSLLRLDVSTPGQAAIPPDNPWAGRPDEGREELWAWGLRNPWRFSFDPEGGRLWIADVGQNRWEEVNVADANAPGLNYGWSITEGPACYGASTCDRTGLVDPVLSYATGTEGCSVIGGYVYRGARMPALEGTYFYSDYCGGWLRSFELSGGAAVGERDWQVASVGRVLALGRDAAGELYLLSQGGGVHRIDPDEG
jgi:glucose/arabinose dehydrogenase